MVIAANLGFPRMGLQRELKKALEAYWKGKSSEDELQSVARELRERHWKMQQESGIEHIPSNDFSFYDHVLDTIAMVGAVPARYGFDKDTVDSDLYFAMARGKQNNETDVVAMEMTKWFDTNYHYIVPEFKQTTEFKLSSLKAVEQYKEAKALGIETRPVLLGPVSFLLQGKAYDDVSPIALLDQLLPVNEQLIAKLEGEGAKSIQIDEPCLVLDLDADAHNAYKKAYQQLSQDRKAKLMLATYFGALEDNLDVALSLPTDGIHIDLVRAPEQLDDVIAKIDDSKWLSVGVVDGRNIWKNNIKESAKIVERAANALAPNRVMVAPSCSLLHSPIDLDDETKLDDEFKNWLAFATNAQAIE